MKYSIQYGIILLPLLLTLKVMMMENSTYTVDDWFNNGRPDKPGRTIDGGWHPHKKARDKKSKKISKMEKFRYFRKRYLPHIMKFLKSKRFKFASHCHEFGSQISLVGKTINEKGKIPKRGEHQYVIHFCDVALHRGKPILMKLYECTTNNLGQVKLELTYQAPQKARNSKSRKLRGLSGRKLTKKMFAMEEVQKKFDKRFPGGENQEFMDHSHYSIDDDVFDKIEQTLEDKPQEQSAKSY